MPHQTITATIRQLTEKNGIKFCHGPLTTSLAAAPHWTGLLRISGRRRRSCAKGRRTVTCPTRYLLVGTVVGGTCTCSFSLLLEKKELLTFPLFLFASVEDSILASGVASVRLSR
ncbi:hypothetical protein Zmor_001162 [Zophobas morio]|uniref:Uncharacterized protein n=1 Tax=Zophobas morio TaxID=2755281 RepID=A0AA38MRA2_9CUCU|nr:hypothetical protein Zmor_001162 [Zophobas morio]